MVLVFWKPASSEDVTGGPNVQLVRFEKTEVRKGKTEFVSVKVDVCKALNLVDSEGKRKLVTGKHSFLVGSPSERQVKHHFKVRLAKDGKSDVGFASF